MMASHPPPIVSGRRVKPRYMTQMKSRPPTFVMWGNKVSDLPESYIRFLTNGLRQTFGLGGGTDPLDSQEGENPYLERKGKEEVGGGA